jgi:prepilin-type N-terminal cleavage/methylation domain-containing protein
MDKLAMMGVVGKMLLSGFKKQSGAKNGFTLVEIVIAMMIGAVVLGAVVTLMGFGISMVTANIGYSAAQRGALSTTEMLSKEIVTAREVEIIPDDILSDAAEGYLDEIEDGWHYVALSSDLKEARHLYQEDGELVNEKIPGSEYIENMRFDTEEFPANLNGGGRLLRVYVNAAYGQGDDVKEVDLNRTMLTHAASGVTGPPGGGRTLRYRLGDPVKPKLNVYESISEDVAAGKATFNYENPVTWESLTNLNYLTELDARLELPPNLLKAVKESGKDVIFTWILADPIIFDHDIVKSVAGKNPEALLEYLEKKVPGYLEEEVGWDLMKDKYNIDALPNPLPSEVMAKLLDDICNTRAEDSTYGLQLMAVMKGKPADEDPGIFDLETQFFGGDEKKFNLGAVVNGVINAHDLCKGAYMIVVAKFPDGKGGWKKWPVYVQLETIPSDSMMNQFVTQAEETSKDHPDTHIGTTVLNTDEKYGKWEEIVNEAERQHFEITGNRKGGGAAPIIMKNLTLNDFSHMIPRGTADKNDILYGVTNYAVYVDVEIPNSGSGGFAVVLNGSKIHVNGLPMDESDKDKKYGKEAEYTSGGHYFQFDPGANGLIIRYFAHQPHVNYRFGQTDTFVFGTRPMYFYDATKENFPAPGGYIDFFKTAAMTDIVTERESFNANAGAGINDKINYRIPFSARQRLSMSAIQGTDVGKLEYLGITPSFSDKTEGRDEINGGTYRGPFNPAYGVTMARGEFSSIYSPKHMQSWHMYPGKKIVEMLSDDKKEDERIGFRWDRSWNMHRYAEPAGIGIEQPPVWEQRHILKLTILEVTRDITAEEVDEEWRYNIHHMNDKPLTGGQLTKLADDYVIHQAGDMFVRAELIHLKPGAKDWNNSRNYVYSKPIWYGKFKGDAWRGDDRSPFKKLGNTMQHIVADPEPLEGDDQSYRRRGMRVRSWKESFLGWDFSTVTLPNYRYVWRNFVTGKAETFNKDDPFGVIDGDGVQKQFPPDFYETVYADGVAGRVDSGKTKTAHSVWTPPLEIDLNADNAREDEKSLSFASNLRRINQSGDPVGDAAVLRVNSAKTFGQYMKSGQYVERARRQKSWGGYEYAYNGKYSPDIYGRLSFLRPWRDTLPNQTTPIFGLYAMRGWDFGTSRILVSGSGEKEMVRVYDSAGNTPKRFLSVVQGLQIPFFPQKLRVWENESETSPRDMSPGGNVFKPDRDRVIGFRFWDNEQVGITASRTRLYDTWIGEGFSPREVRAILGLTTTDKKTIRGTYVDQSMEEAGFYVPPGEGE